jgi:hypothetical protein
MQSPVISEKRGRRGVRRRKVTRSITVIERVILYLKECARRGADWFRWHHKTFARRLGVCERSVKAARSALEAKGVLRFERHRIGRSPALFVVFGRSPADTRSKGSGHGAKDGGIGGKGDFLPENKGKLKHRKSPAAQAKAAVDVERGLRRKAWWVARQCADKHWDNCKVRVSLRHAYGYALRALKAGKRDADIIAAYDAALHQRHKDATDAGLSCGNPRLVWEPSSTVSLATAMLAGAAGLSEDQRKAKRAVAWLGTLGREAYADFRHWFDAAGESLDALYGETVELFGIVGRYLRWQREQGTVLRETT